nr:unnamed protein product [Digitaria exilis]
MQPINITRSNLITPPGLQPSQQIVQSLGTQNPQHMAFQMQDINFSTCNPEYIAHPQGQPLVQPNVQQNHLLRQNARETATTGSSGDVDWREEMFQQMKPLKDAYLSELKELNQAVLVPKITQEQFESLPEDKADRQRFKVNLKRKMAVMLKFIQLQKNDIPDNFRGKLPMFLKSVQDLLASYRRIKDRTVDGRCKSQTHHGQHQITNLSGDQFPSGCSASHQNQQEQPMHTQLRENIIRTTPAGCQVISSHLLGAASSCFPENSHRSLQSSPTDKFQECSMTTPSPVIKSAIVNVSSPYASLKFTSPSAITAPGATEAAASSSVSVMSPLPSPVAMPGDVNVVSPCASVNSTVPTAITDSASIQAASPSSSAKSTVPSPSEMSGVIEATAPVTNSGCAPVAFPCPAVQPTSSENDVIFSDLLLQDNSAAASALAVVEETATQAEEDSREVAAIKPIIPASPLQAETADPAEYNKHPGNELPIAKRPIDRLLDAVRASSPAMLTSAANCVYSVLNSNDWAPHRETDEFEDWAFFSEQGGSNTPNKMKRDFDTTSVLSESAPLGTSSASENNAEHGAKRPKTKDAKDTLLDEINSANRMLLDTLISITDDNKTDGIPSSNGGTLIKLSYTATSLAPDLASLFATSGMSIVMPLNLLVPEDYPISSPVIVCDKGDEEMRKSLCDISGEVDSAFRRTLRGLPEPMSVVDMARVWDESVRRVVVEFAKQHGGGTISSSHGEWASADGA